MCGKFQVTLSEMRSYAAGPPLLKAGLWVRPPDPFGEDRLSKSVSAGQFLGNTGPQDSRDPSGSQTGAQACKGGKVHNATAGVKGRELAEQVPAGSY